MRETAMAKTGGGSAGMNPRNPQNHQTILPSLETKMPQKIKSISRLKLVAVPFMGLALLAAQTNAANATIDNTAKATGTYGATNYDSPDDIENVTPTAPVPGLQIVKSITTTPTITAGADPSVTDAGDTIVYSYSITNTGNVTMTNVRPFDVGPTFNGFTGTGAMTAFTGVTMAPGAPAQVFSATYTMTALDIARSAGVTNNVDNVATARGVTPAAVAYESGNSNIVETTIPAGPLLRVTKSSAITHIAGGNNGATTADVGETIVYTYLVENIGNVTMTDVNVSDVHEGTAVPSTSITHAASLTSNGTLGAAASTDGVASAQIWGNLGPGASIAFTYTHIVNQTEFNAQ